jgi:hypothetical protein
MDLLAGWSCAAFGAALAMALLMYRPRLHEHPMAVFRTLLLLATFALVVVGPLSLRMPAGGSLPGGISILPMVGTCHHTWTAVLGEYTRSFLQYGLLAGLCVAWSRSAGRRPWSVLVMSAPLALCSLLMVFSLHLGRGVDTAPVVLALLAGGLALRVDSALFGLITSPPAGEETASEPPPGISAGRFASEPAGR